MYVPNRNFLLLVTAVAEAATGVGLLAIPTVVSTLLLGSGEIASQTLFFERVAGAALLCIGVASWLSKSDSQSAALRGQLVGLTIYNGLAAIVLAYGGIGLKMAGILLWPAFVFHAALTVWCFACLRAPGTAAGPA